MVTSSQRTPFGTTHVTYTGPAEKESQLKARMTRTANTLGMVPLTRRSHVIGDTVTVFGIYRKS